MHARGQDKSSFSVVVASTTKLSFRNRFLYPKNLKVLWKRRGGTKSKSVDPLAGTTCPADGPFCIFIWKSDYEKLFWRDFFASLELFSSSFQHHFHFLWHWAITMSPIEWVSEWMNEWRALHLPKCIHHFPLSACSLIQFGNQSANFVSVATSPISMIEHTASLFFKWERERVHLWMSTELRVLELANAANWLEVIGSSGKLVSFSASMISRFLSLSPKHLDI